MIRQLLQSGADFDALDGRKATALATALEAGNQAMLIALCRFSGDEPDHANFGYSEAEALERS